jgi:hypothetical protein
MEYEYINWAANLLSFLVFIYILIKTFNSPCFDTFDTFLVLTNILISVIAQFVSVIIKKTKDE